LFFLPFTWGRHCRAPATTALPGTTSLELLILFDNTAPADRADRLSACVDCYGRINWYFSPHTMF
jgi:hypothetical protein